MSEKSILLIIQCDGVDDGDDEVDDDATDVKEPW